MRMNKWRVMFILLLVGILSGPPRYTFASGPHEHRYHISVERRAGEHEDGVRLYVCEICGETYREVIPASGHVWSEWVVEREATEDREGIRCRVCTRYPEHPHYEYETIPRLDPLTADSPDSPASTREEGVSTASEDKEYGASSHLVMAEAATALEERAVIEELRKIRE